MYQKSADKMAFEVTQGSATHSECFAAQEFGFSLGRAVLVGTSMGQGERAISQHAPTHKQRQERGCKKRNVPIIGMVYRERVGVGGRLVYFTLHMNEIKDRSWDSIMFVLTG